MFSKLPKSTEIYNSAINNVVELKAENHENFVNFGTAVLMNENAEFMTNAHIVTYTMMSEVRVFDSYYIRFAFEDDYREVELIKYDLLLDLAVLRITDILFIRSKPIQFGNSNELKSGETVYAIGNSQNYGISISVGIIGIPRINVEYQGSLRSVIQCDITITSGNSGGALLNAKGKLVGITTFRLRDNAGDVIYGIAYSIPVNQILKYLNNNDFDSD